MPRGVSRGPDDRVTELDQQIARLRARKEALLAREKRQRKRRDQRRAKIAGEALRRVYGSWEAPKLLAWVQRFLISDQERRVFGFKPLEEREKKQRLAKLREREAHWDQAPSEAAGGQPKQPDAAGGDARSGSSAGVTPPAGGGVDPADDTRADWIL